MTARMADERNRNVEAKFEALSERDEARGSRDYWIDLYGELRDELQAKLDAAEAERDRLEAKWVEAEKWADVYREERDDLKASIRELQPAEGWPEWLGPKVDPDDFEVTRGEDGYVYVDGFNAAGPSVTAKSIREIPYGSDVVDRAKREAVARFIESEQAKRDDETSLADSATGDEDQRIEEQAKALHESTGVSPWALLLEQRKENYRAAIRAGWTKEADK